MAKFFIATHIELLQQVRLIHALAELKDHQFLLPGAELAKLQPLVDQFALTLSAGDGQNVFLLSPHLHIDHKSPSTRIGDIQRPLIFARSMTEYCRSLWRAQRKNRYSFVGLFTPQRQSVLFRWMQVNQISRRVFPDLVLNTFNHLLYKALGEKQGNKRHVGPLLLWSSSRGRIFPGKSWDEPYFNTLANSQFVLCPNGDFVWSYRFFEAILCGAIPIIQDICSLYEGFRFYTFQDNAHSLQWSEADAIHNYQLCQQHITVGADELRRALEDLLTGKRGRIQF